MRGYHHIRDVEKGKDEKKKSWKETFATGWKTIKMIAPYFWPKGEPALRFRVIVCIFLLVGGKVVNQFIPITYARAIDSLPATVPIFWILAYNFLRWLGNNMRDIRDSVFVKVENHTTKAISLHAFEHLTNLSLGFHLTRNTGALLRTMDRGKNAITTLFNMLGFVIAPTLLEVFMTCAVMFSSFGGWYSLIAFMTISSYIAFTLIITEWRTKYRRAMNDKDNESNNTALDSLINYETVKYFTAERHELKRYDKVMSDYFDINVKSQLSLALLNIGQVAIIALGLTIAMILAAFQVSSGKLTVGELVAINAYIIQLYTPLSWLGTSYRMIITSFTDMEKLFELFEEKPDVVDPPGARKLQILPHGGEIEFKNVAFTYPKRGQSSVELPTLKNISFSVPAGKTVAIVGPSGSGKTTISRLLCRYYSCQSGAIYIDGQDISQVQQRSVRKVIGVVPQDTVLFNDTLEYNIEYGVVAKSKRNPNMSVEQAAREANIHDFIMGLPDKYQTKVGERGLRLSGGEKQRVAIARTILKDPPILILDEATSALDSKTEKEIQNSLMHISKGRTTLIVAHRLSTIVNADEILVLKNGEIKERGTHHQLLELRGEYAQMWELQAQENTTKPQDNSTNLLVVP